MIRKFTIFILIKYIFTLKRMKLAWHVTCLRDLRTKTSRDTSREDRPFQSIKSLMRA
jgi:hypothetical protein